MDGNSGDEDRLRLILYLADLIETRFKKLTLESFANDEDEVDLAAFRLGHIGENAIKLSSNLKARHPEIEWSAIAAFRNVMFHSYLGLEPDHMWSAIKNSVPILVAVSKVELDQTTS